MDKSGIKNLLANWYIFKSADNIYVASFLITAQQALDRLYCHEQLDNTDTYILDRYSQGYTMTEIGGMLNISRQAVSKRLDRIAELLRIDLDD